MGCCVRGGGRAGGRGPRRGWREMGGGGGKKSRVSPACPSRQRPRRLPARVRNGSAPNSGPARSECARTHARSPAGRSAHARTQAMAGRPSQKKKMLLTPKTLPRWKRCRPTAGTGPRRPPFGSHCVWWRVERGKVEVRRAGAEGQRRRRRTGERAAVSAPTSPPPRLSHRGLSNHSVQLCSRGWDLGASPAGASSAMIGVCVCVWSARVEERDGEGETGRSTDCAVRASERESARRMGGGGIPTKKRRPRLSPQVRVCTPPPPPHTPARQSC